MPNPFDELVSQSTGASIDSGTLQLLGKEASAGYVDSGVPLNDSVVKLASRYPHMTSEHVRRVVEYANIATYSALFEKESSAVRNVEFPYADAEVILGEMAKQADPMVEIPADHAYQHAVPDYKERLHEKEADAILANAFGIPVEKRAEVPDDQTLGEKAYTNLYPLGTKKSREDILATRRKAQAKAEVKTSDIKEWQALQGGMEHLAADVSGIEIAYDQAGTRFEDAVKQAALSGRSLEEIGMVIHGVLGEKTSSVRDHLVGAIRKVQTVAPDLQLTADAEKVAGLSGRVIDVSSELAQSAHFLGEIVENRTLLKYAQQELKSQFTKVDRAVRGLGT